MLKNQDGCQVFLNKIRATESTEEHGSISSKAFFKAAYKNHPYAFSADGEIDSVKAMTIEDLESFYKKY